MQFINTKHSQKYSCIVSLSWMLLLLFFFFCNYFKILTFLDFHSGKLIFVILCQMREKESAKQGKLRFLKKLKNKIWSKVKDRSQVFILRNISTNVNAYLIYSDKDMKYKETSFVSLKKGESPKIKHATLLLGKPDTTKKNPAFSQKLQCEYST